ncbi:hypothetical protein BOX15_Mlig015706g5, partial [Macrostomum lignano]
GASAAAATAARSWRDSASLILVTEGLRVLLLKRAAKSSFFANARVFPGGAFDPGVDASADWLPLFRANGGRSFAAWHPGADGLAAQAAQFASARRAPIFESGAAASVAPLALLPEVALRICALRETFEECGLLLAADGDGNRVPHDTWASGPELRLAEWQSAVKQDGREFLRLFSSLGLCPDLHSLYEWSNWLTPSTLSSPRRFDTAFFLCCLPAAFQVRLDLAEMSGEHDWLPPVEAIDRFHSEPAFSLSPPTLYELAKLAGQADSLQSLEAFAKHRGRLGTELYFPVLGVGQRLAFTMHPGDCRYPASPDFNSGRHVDLGGIGDDQLMRDRPANRIVHAVNPDAERHVTPEGAVRPALKSGPSAKFRLDCRGLRPLCGFRPPLVPPCARL